MEDCTEPTMSPQSGPATPQPGSTHQIAQPSYDALILNELRQMNDRAQKLAAKPPLKSQAIWTFILQTFGIAVGTLFGIFAVLAWKVACDGNTMSANNNDAANAANELASSAYQAAVSANSYAVGAISIAVSANSYALEANKIALFEECQSILLDSITISDSLKLCSAIRSEYLCSLSEYASRYYTIEISTTVSSPGSTTPTPTVLSSLVPSLTSSLSTTSDTIPTGGTNSSPSPNRESLSIAVGSSAGVLLLVASAIALNVVIYRERLRRSQKFLPTSKHEEEVMKA